MRINKPTNEQSLTGVVPRPTSSGIMQQRINAIKYRSSDRSFNLKKNQAQLKGNSQNKVSFQTENDTQVTNFWPIRPTMGSSRKNLPPQSMQKRSQDGQNWRPRSHSLQMRNFRVVKPPQKIKIKTNDASTYIKEIKCFSELYQVLANVLASIKGGFQEIEEAISEYGRYIQKQQLHFIDDFMEGRQGKLKKTMRVSRIHEYLSIAYLFLEIAQDRIDNNQSYLINFIGFCLSNLIFSARVYMILEKKPQYEIQAFEQQVCEFETVSYGEPLLNLDDVLLRMQHNNQIITMIHKKLGRCNEKFEECIKVFLKNAERKKYTTSLCSHYIFQYLAMHIYESDLIGISEFLQVAPTPYLAPPSHKYTLVFEPIGIMKHGTQLRPYLLQFIKWAYKHFDIVMWSWQMPYELQPLTELLDPYLFAKLYRYHCIIKDQVYTKDLNRLGRSLEKTLIIDYDERIFSETPKNGLVCRWKGKSQDKGLLVLCQILEQMLSSDSGVEEMFTFYSEELNGIRGI